MNANVDHRVVEYIGYLPYLKNDLKVATHPQFKHLATPPDRYSFRNHFPWQEIPSPLTTFVSRVFSSTDQLARAEKMIRKTLVEGQIPLLIRALISLCRQSIKNGANSKELLRFFWTRRRSLADQFLISAKTEMAFVPSFPVTLGQVPWVIEIEDSTTLFYPFLHNGWSGDIKPSQIPCYPVIKAMIESDQCRGIFTHVRSTAESLPRIFSNDQLASKIYYVPLGIPAISSRVRTKTSRSLNLLFTNSWHQNWHSFYYRGGLDLLDAFQTLKTKYPEITLTLRTKLPPDLPERYRWIIENYGVRVLADFLPEERHAQLIDETDIFVLPSARLHVVSILEMMGRGIPVVVSDGWGIEEYVENERNGLVVKGRLGKCAWIEPESGMLREDYSSLFESDVDYSTRLAAQISRLIEDPTLREKIARNGIADVRDRHSIELMNKALGAALDAAYN